ncbi:cadmium resistance transporter [Paraburkholderia sp. PREW-6R]|uniref:cadmium resistance transporter n=1 Tax=Paraburkholderia sp. PREW-6R TaxID=3141544 RepID=UPI0031F4DE90
MLSLALLAIAAYAATNIDNLFVLLAFLADAKSPGQRRRVIAGQCAGSLTLIAASALLALMLTRLPAGYVGLLGLLPIGVGLAKAWERFGPVKSGVKPPGPAMAESSETGVQSADSANASHPSDPQRVTRFAGTVASASTAKHTNDTLPAESAKHAAAPEPSGHAPSPSRSTSWWTVACVAVANGSDNLAVYVPLYAAHSHGEGALISLVFTAMIALWCAGSVWLVEHPLLGAPIRRYGTALLPFILLIIGGSVIAENDTLRIVFGV